MASIYVDFGPPIADYCQVISLQFSPRVRPVAGGPSHGAQRKDLSFTKRLDTLSSDLFRHCAAGTVIKKVLVEYYNNDDAPYAVYTLNNVVIAGYQSSGGSDAPTEAVTLDFETWSGKYYEPG